MPDDLREALAKDVEDRIAWATEAHGHTYSRADASASKERARTRWGIALFVAAGAAGSALAYGATQSWAGWALVALAAGTGALVCAAIAALTLARKAASARTAIFIESGAYEVWVPKAERYLMRVKREEDYDVEARKWDRLNGEREQFRRNALQALERSDTEASQQIQRAVDGLMSGWRMSQK